MTQSKPTYTRKLFATAALLLIATFGTALHFSRTGGSELSAHGGASARSRRLAEFPAVIVWAWERPEDLSFIDTREVGVAYLARTVHLRGDGAVVQPRLQPLKVAPDAALIAVVRIESDRGDAPTLSTNQLAQTIRACADALRARNVRALQIDFDAVQSERDFYSKLLAALRREIPAEMPLSITALASWCLQDDWISDLPVDEAVPMLFRIGVDEHRIHIHLQAGGEFCPRLCRSSVGLSTDETLNFKPTRPARTYIFHPRPWTAPALRHALERQNDPNQDS